MATGSTSLLQSQRPGACLWWLEDDRQLCRLVRDRLVACGWTLVLFHRVAEVLKALQREEPDLLILDRILPGANGIELLAHLRQERFRFPVLLLTVQGSPNERIEGLEMGANDVLPKPFRTQELLWRIERLLLASSPRLLKPTLLHGVVAVGSLLLDRARGCLRDAQGGEVQLSRGDVVLLSALLQSPGTVMSREQLAEASGSLVNVQSSRSLDVRFSRLRRLLRQLTADAVSIEAVRGKGYRLMLPAGTAELVATSPRALVVALLALLPQTMTVSALMLFLVAVLFAGVLLWTQVLRPLAHLRRDLRLMQPRLSIWPLPLEGIAPLRELVARLNTLHASQTLQVAEWHARLRTLLHDQRAPLSRLMLRTEDLGQDHPPDQGLLEGIAADLELLRQLEQELAGLADEPLDAVEHQHLPLDELCQRLVRHYRPESVRLAVPHLLLRLEAGGLQRVLHNLVDNALEHGNPPVLIRAYPVPGALVVEVQDQGPALPALTSQLAGGSPQGGLGYALALDFCRHHGGRLELEQQVGGGLLVRLRIDNRFVENGGPASHSVTR